MAVIVVTQIPTTRMAKLKVDMDSLRVATAALLLPPSQAMANLPFLLAGPSSGIRTPTVGECFATNN